MANLSALWSTGSERDPGNGRKLGSFRFSRLWPYAKNMDRVDLCMLGSYRQEPKRKKGVHFVGIELRHLPQLLSIFQIRKIIV